MTESFGIACGVISMLGYGLSNVAAKPLARAVGSAHAIAYRQLLVCLVLGVPIFVFDLPDTVTPLAVGQTIVISVLGYLPLLLFFQGLKIGKVGVISALTQAKILVTAALSIIFLGEIFSEWQLVGVILVFGGLVLLSFNPEELRSNRLMEISEGAGYALSAGALWGVVFFLFKHSVGTLGPWLATFCIESTVCVCAWMHASTEQQPNDQDPISRMRFLLYVAIGALTAATGTLFFNLGITAADVSVVCTFTFSASVISALAGWWLLGESLNRRQIASVAAVVAGVVAVTL